MRNRIVTASDRASAFLNDVENRSSARNTDIVESVRDRQMNAGVTTAILGGILGAGYAFWKHSGPGGYFAYGLVGAFIGSAMGGIWGLFTKDKSE